MGIPYPISLSSSDRHGMRLGEMAGTKVAPSAPPVNPLLFAHDYILVCKEDVLDVTNINKVLKKYCNALGQGIHQDKCLIFFGKGCPRTM